MGVLTMDMGSYEVQQDDSTETEYDDEILDSGWNPTLDLQQSQIQSFENLAEIPDDMVTMSADLFLRKMYSYQH